MQVQERKQMESQPPRQLDLRAEADAILNQWPSVGLAVGVVRDGRLQAFEGRGLADIATGRPVTEDTVFRIGSVTKTFTAIAVMQLWEQGLLDLDAPANGYLRAYQLVPARASFAPVTVRHLLTHTSGIRELLHLSGLLSIRDLGETMRAGWRVPSPAEYYHGALRFECEPGTRYMYTNHGYVTLGQIVEDITGRSLAGYMRERIFEPLGLEHTDLVRSDRVSSSVATPYDLRGNGAAPIPDYEAIGVAGGGAYSSPRDVARYLAALMNGGANEHGSVLKPATLAMMFAPHFQPDPRIPGQGFAFARADLGGHLGVEHSGVLPGFDTQIYVAPEDGVAVMAFANGAKRGMLWLAPVIGRLVRELLGVPEDVIRTDLPQHPELWADLCGSYSFEADWTDVGKLFIGPWTEVKVRRGQLTLSSLSPLPALFRGFVLHPDDANDPDVFRIRIPWFGLGTGRVIFSRKPGAGVTAFYLDFAPLSFRKRRSTS